MAGQGESVGSGRSRYPARRALPSQKEVHALESSSSIAPARPPESLSKLTFRVRSATPLESIEMPALEATEPGEAWRWGISTPSYEGALRPLVGSLSVVVLRLGHRRHAGSLLLRTKLSFRARQRRHRARNLRQRWNRRSLVACQGSAPRDDCPVFRQPARAGSLLLRTKLSFRYLFRNHFINKSFERRLI